MCLAYHENYFDHESYFDKVNAISDPPIPAATGKLEKLQTVDHSNHTFCGEPSPLGYLKNLNTCQFQTFLYFGIIIIIIIILVS
ncbi:hypothetical protein NC652_002475 [Populus alba x Populus x berolinensis]|nr:hypothetical protein NC652_002475 [Populus alba x Populus x berolinensis]